MTEPKTPAGRTKPAKAKGAAAPKVAKLPTKPSVGNPAKAPASKPVAAAGVPKAKPALKVVGKPAPATAPLKLKDLIAAVAAETGAKRPEVRATVEATLAVLADALKRGADLNLPPLGRLRVARATGKDGTGAMTLKLRLGGDKAGAKALADDGEDS
jgi:nucleoid DNA-binding protein